MRKVSLLLLTLTLMFTMIPMNALGATKKPGKVKFTSAEIKEYYWDEGKYAKIMFKWTKTSCNGYQILETGPVKETYTSKTNQKLVERYPVEDKFGESAYVKDEYANYSFKVRAFRTYKQKQYLTTKNKWVTKKPSKYKKTRNVTKRLYGPWSNTLKVNMITGEDVPEKKSGTSILNKPMSELSDEELREGIRSEVEKLVIAAGGKKYYKGGSMTFVKGPENVAKAFIDYMKQHPLNYGKIDIGDEFSKDFQINYIRKYGTIGDGTNLFIDPEGNKRDENGPLGAPFYHDEFNFKPSSSINDAIKTIKKTLCLDTYRIIGVARDENHVVVVIDTSCPL